MKRFIQATGAAILLGLSLANPTLAKDVKIGLSWDARESALNQAWEDFMKAEAKIQGPPAGINVEWVVNMADNDSSRQAANIEDLLNSGVDIVIARALDAAAIGSSIRRAKEAGVPFVTFDRASSGVQPTAHVGGDSADQARVAGAELEKILIANHVKGVCIELQGSLADINAINRTNEWKALDERSDVIDIVTRIPTEWNPEKVLSGLNDALRAHPEANCILAASDWAIDAVQAALEKVDRWYPTGNPKHMWIASCDLLTSAVGAMEKGYIDVAVTWDAEAHAKEAVRVLMLIAQGKDPQCPKQGCLAKGAIATPANVKSMTNYWARKYK